MILKPGEKIHVVVRRAFAQDMRRHFIGEVMDATESVVRAEGHAYLYDTNTNLFVKKKLQSCPYIQPCRWCQHYMCFAPHR